MLQWRISILTFFRVELSESLWLGRHANVRIRNCYYSGSATVWLCIPTTIRKLLLLWIRLGVVLTGLA
jgi:hypothetical protein